jgi:hypothetical protein
MAEHLNKAGRNLLPIWLLLCAVGITATAWSNVHIGSRPVEDNGAIDVRPLIGKLGPPWQGSNYKVFESDLKLMNLGRASPFSVAGSHQSYSPLQDDIFTQQIIFQHRPEKRRRSGR